MQSDATHEDPKSRIAALEGAVLAREARISELTDERDRLRKALEAMRIELELLKRRIFVAKAERVDTKQLELEFAAKLAALDALAGVVPTGALHNDDAAAATPDGQPDTPPAGDGKAKAKAKPKGRRDLRVLDLPEERIEILDPELEGKAKRIDFEESCRLGYRRGGLVRVVVARAKYLVETASGDRLIETVPVPPETLSRSLAAPSLVAHIAAQKHLVGMPLFRQEEGFARDGVDIDRGTMCRWLEDSGATLGATVVEAARAEALATAFCIATDATGVAVQPEPMKDRKEKKRQPCRRGHYVSAARAPSGFGGASGATYAHEREGGVTPRAAFVPSCPRGAR